MSEEIIHKAFIEHGLSEAYERVKKTSPYTHGVIVQYWPKVKLMLESGYWISRLDYSDCEPADYPMLHGLKNEAGDKECKTLIRQFRNLHSARILWHDLNDLSDWQTVFKSQSDLADICSKYVLNFLEKDFTLKYQVPRYSDGTPMQLSILAMGKWGGRELNFSSDIDFVMVYAESGLVEGKDGRRDIEHHQFFTKIAQRFIKIIDDVTSDGFVYRCDTRLRPFGDSGPLVVSLAALEQYLTQHGREWERYAYLKARCVTGDDLVISDFEDLRRPFVYRRYLDYGVFEKLREMHRQIMVQIEKNDNSDNIKLGRGGIRECEFLIQAMQLLRGGRIKSLQQANFYKAYQAVNNTEVWVDEDQKCLAAYVYLRLLENRLQGLHQQQTHQLPDNAIDQDRLATAMYSNDWADMKLTLQQHRNNVQESFNQQLSLFMLQDTIGQKNQLKWQDLLDSTEFFPVTTRQNFHALEKSRFYRSLREESQKTLDKLLVLFLQEIRSRTSELAINELAIISAADNFLKVITAIGKRAVYFSLLVERPAALKHLCDVCFTSDYLCKQIAQWPILLDELLDSRIFNQVPARSDINKATIEFLANTRSDITEQFINDLVTLKHIQSFRIATAEIFKRLPLMKVSDRLSDLAELILEAVFTLVLKETIQKFQLTELSIEDCGFSILAYGKLGGLELNYTSDLDIVFIYDKSQLPAEHKLLNDEPLCQRFYTRLVQQCLRYLNLPTSMGKLYEIDTRLRPSGNSGFLVSSLEAFEHYQKEDAWVWEHQALTRARVVLGSETLRAKIDNIRLEVLSCAEKYQTLDTEVINMRNKMREQFQNESLPENLFHLKQSPGGMIDLEFLVQYLVLKYTHVYPSVAEFSDNVRQLEALANVGVITQASAIDLKDAYIHLREQAHLLSLQFREPLVEIEVISAERDLVIRYWNQFLSES